MILNTSKLVKDDLVDDFIRFIDDYNAVSVFILNLSEINDTDAVAAVIYNTNVDSIYHIIGDEENEQKDKQMLDLVKPYLFEKGKVN